MEYVPIHQATSRLAVRNDRPAEPRSGNWRAGSCAVSIYLLALCLSVLCAHAQTRVYKGGGFEFQYPSNWKVAREQKDVKFRLDREQMPYSFAGLDTADGDAAIFVWHGKFPREINCGGAHTYMQRLIGEDFSFSSFFDQHDTIERADAGQVFTTTFKRSLKYPNHEILASTICRTSGEVAYIVFGYAHGYPQQTRDLVMRTFVFNGEQTLLGDWDGEGVVLTFNENGTAAMSFTSAPFSPNRGKYRISDGHVIFSWDVMMGVPKATRRDCSYTLRGDRLTLSCDDGRTMTFHR